MEKSSLKEKTAKGVLWSGVSSTLQQLLNLAFGIILGRLLSPEEYGMVGQIQIFTLIAASLQESGFTAALVNRPTLSHRDCNAVFWATVPVSWAIYALLFFAAPLIANFFNEPELVALSRYAFLGFIISALGIVASARLLKTLRARERTIANLSALLISGIVGVVLAFRGYSYWGIATQTLVYNAVNTTLYFYFARWRPTLEFDYTPVREMLGFSSRLLITNLISHLNNNFFALFFGRIYGTAEVGNYNQANKWNYMGHSIITGIVMGVAQPMFVETADDRPRQQRAFRKMLRLTAVLTFPVMLGIALISRELIWVTIGEKWMASADMLSALCVAGAFLPIVALYTQFLLSRALSNVYMWGLLALVTTQLAAAFVTAPYGIATMIWTYVAINVLWCIFWHYFVRRELNISFRQAAMDILPFALLSAATMFATQQLLALFTLPLWGSLLAKIAVAAAAYPLLLWCTGAQIFRESLAYLLKKQRRS